MTCSAISVSLVVKRFQKQLLLCERGFFVILKNQKMKIGNFAEVRKLIRQIKKKWYQIRLSGGTSKNRKFNSIVIAILIDFYKRLFIAVVPYEPNASVIKKSVLLDNENESKEQLAIRKLKDEVGFDAKVSDLILLDKDEELDNELNDGSSHIKYTFYIEKFTGSFVDLTNNSFLMRKTFNPFWIPAFLVPGVIFRKHLNLFEKLIEDLLSKDKINQDYYNVLKNEIYRRRGLDQLRDKLKQKQNIAPGSRE